MVAAWRAVRHRRKREMEVVCTFWLTFNNIFGTSTTQTQSEIEKGFAIVSQLQQQQTENLYGRHVYY